MITSGLPIGNPWIVGFALLNKTTTNRENCVDERNSRTIFWKLPCEQGVH
jgi:hypothetical protein